MPLKKTTTKPDAADALVGSDTPGFTGGIDPKKIEVHGNNKSVAEIERAVQVGVKTIVIDSLFEVERVAAAATKYGVRQAVMLRLTPGVEAHTHESISTAHEDVKFGFSAALVRIISRHCANSA